MELHASSNANKKEVGISFSVSKIGVIVVGVIILAFFAGKYLMSVKVFGSSATNIPGSVQLDSHLLDNHAQSAVDQKVIYGVSDPQSTPAASSPSATKTIPLSPTLTLTPSITPLPTATKTPTPTPTVIPTAVPPTLTPTSLPSPTSLPPTPTEGN